MKRYIAIPHQGPISVWYDPLPPITKDGDHYAMGDRRLCCILPFNTPSEIASAQRYAGPHWVEVQAVINDLINCAEFTASVNMLAATILKIIQSKSGEKEELRALADDYIADAVAELQEAVTKKL